MSYPGLDSIRAIAAISVLATHTTFWSGAYQDGYQGALFARLDIGVAIFFVLSGFLLSMPFIENLAYKNEKPKVGRYFWKRALRIVPLYWIVVASALLFLPQNRGANSSVWLTNLTFTQIYFPDTLPHGLTQMWSLATEVAFYVCLPLFVLALFKRVEKHGWKPRKVLVSLAIMGLINIIWLMFANAYALRATVWLPSFFTWFGAGILISVFRVELNHGNNRFSRIHSVAAQPGVCWTFAISLFAVAATPIAGPIIYTQFATGLESVAKNLTYAAIAVLIIIPTVFAPESKRRYDRFIENPFLRHLGLISYGIFAIHLIVLQWVTKYFDLAIFEGHGAERFVLTLVITVVLSEVSYRLIESPALRLKNWTPFKATPRSAATQSDVMH